MYYARDSRAINLRERDSERTEKRLDEDEQVLPASCFFSMHPTVVFVNLVFF